MRLGYVLGLLRHKSGRPVPGRPQFPRFLTGAIQAGVFLAMIGCAGVSSGPPPAKSPAQYPDPSPGTTGSFFGINANSLADPWPATMIPVSSWRSLGASVKWADIDSNGVYDWSRLDKWLAQAKAQKTDVLYTVYATPSWASSRGMNSASPNSGCTYQQQNGPGVCDPPSDLNCDGTGSNQAFQNFVSALIQHAGPGTIKYWELWNEPNVDAQWNGDADCAASGVQHAGNLMLARMAKDLRTIVRAADAKAMFTTPAATSATNAGNWLADYLTNTDGGNYADINAFHGYVGTGMCPSECPVAERVQFQIEHLTSLLPPAAQGKPLFDTEGAWGAPKNANGKKVNAITDADQQQSFLARYYLMQMWKGVAKFYWWNWDLANMSSFYDAGTHSLNQAGVAYTQIVRWTNGGSAKVESCSTNPSVPSQWTCIIKSPKGLESQAIWDTAQSCESGNCSTVDVTVPSQFNAYLDLGGNANTISGQQVAVGLKPILLIQQ